MDVNVIVDLTTIVDLNKAALSSAIILEHIIAFRRRRSREALVVAWVLHLKRKTAISLRHEGIRILAGSEHLSELEKTSILNKSPTKGLAPPGSIDGLTMEFFLYFLKDEVLPEWQWIAREDPESSDRDMSGNACDRLLVDIAQQQNIPVVTAEMRPDGAIAKRARSNGVIVLTPANWVVSQVITRRLSTRALIDQLALELLARVREKMLEFMTKSNNQLYRNNCADYVHLLSFVLDESEELDLPDPMNGWKFS